MRRPPPSRTGRATSCGIAAVAAWLVASSPRAAEVSPGGGAPRVAVTRWSDTPAAQLAPVSTLAIGRDGFLC